MKVVILAGGFGTRLSEHTNIIPKPMLQVNGKPILIHIMEYYASYGHKDFYIALGYKSEVIKDYFSKLPILSSDFTIDLKTGSLKIHKGSTRDWTVTLVDTGINSLTGGRLKRLKKYIGDESFMMTYGDGLSDVNIDNLLDFHQEKKSLVTVTAVRPAARFGELDISNEGVVNSFQEKPQTSQGWINGGYFVMEPGFLDFIENDQTILEKEPLETAASNRLLSAFKHKGFWQCIDTKRDLEYLNSLTENQNIPWRRK